MDKIQHGSNYNPPSDEQSESFKDKYADYSVKELAQAFKHFKDEHNRRREHAAEAFHEWNFIRFLIPEKMEELGMTTAKIEGVGRVQLSQQASCKQLDFDALSQWMEEHGHKDLIKETINASTLTAFIKAQIAAGEEIPSSEIIDFKPYTVGTVVKA